jgi:hypothetical protein
MDYGMANKDQYLIRLDEAEKYVRINVENLQQEMIKLSKETYYEFDMIDSKLFSILTVY